MGMGMGLGVGGRQGKLPGTMGRGGRCAPGAAAAREASDLAGGGP